MTRLGDRLEKLERSAGPGVGSIDTVEVFFVEPSPAGPIYTGEVCTMRLGGDSAWSDRPEIAGQSAR